MTGAHAHDEGERWLALTCEVEREAPSLLDSLGVRACVSEEARLDLMLREGDEATFFGWLRETREALETSGKATVERTRLAEVLAEVYLLLPGFREPLDNELDELQRLQAHTA